MGAQASAIGNHIAQIGGAVQKGDAETLKAGSLVAKSRFEVARDRATGGDGRLSGMRRGRLGVSFKIAGREAIFRATGPWQIVEGDTSPHLIRPRRKRAVVIPGVGPRRFANHPGTTGKHPWAKGSGEAVKPAAAVMRTRILRIVRSAMS